MIWLSALLLGCSGGDATDAPTRPTGVPVEAVVLRLDDEGVHLGDKQIDARAALEADLVDGIHEPLLEALDGKERAWIVAPAETPWMIVRKLVVSAHEAGVTQRWVSVAGGTQAFGPSAPPRARYLPSCNDVPLEVQGVARRLIVEIFHGGSGTWVETAVQFNPKVGGVAAISLPPSCWDTSGCDAVGSRAPACEGALGTRVERRVPVAGAVGCILPIRKQIGDEQSWPAELAANLKGLGITPDDEATLIIEANAPWAAATAVMHGFAEAGLPAPGIGLPLVEGHGSPPLCTATIRDAATLETAAAKWFGSKLAATPDQATP